MLLDQTYEQYKSMLFGLAYRMLGSVADAEDIVQDVFARYIEVDRDGIASEKAYLTKMTANRCLNLLQSSARQREQYVGPWLPEPLPEDGLSGFADPAERRENIGYAYLVLLQELSPLERAIYILKETLGFDYRGIADMLDKTEISCRKTFSRAKMKVDQASPGQERDQPEGQEGDAREKFVDAFLRASDTGNFKPLVAFLLDEVILLSDGGGKVRAALNPIIGIERVQAFFEGLAAKGTFKDGFKRIVLNGELGLLLERDGRNVLALCAEREPGGPRIRRIYIVLNPDKLERFNQ
ncbi:sigma-70 family RNA polymerase sigma factor [Cohnella endophytica]|uniref:Sigma-70 family RNA polymerase sigma factor n=1 Tax=Cohnella endophytica TaxID=2419778 RepID=A0A494XLP2_9BACL|nr:sigma-70 family RNA polymerase sigma factor [Cohnella endophytica]RKP51615.1 sigma-70 family RNA polymerase sigma factor [Cohnella endophytica]